MKIELEEKGNKTRKEDNIMEKEYIGYPSIDKIWTKYYSEEAKNPKIPECSLYEYLYENNKNYPNGYAINYFGKKIKYGELFSMIDESAKALQGIGVKPGEIVSIVTVSTVTSVVLFYALNKIGAVSNYLNVLSEGKEFETYFSEAKSKVVLTLDLFADKIIKAAGTSGVERVIVFSVDENMPIATKLGYRIKAKSVQYEKSTKVILWKEFLKLSKGQGEITYKKNTDEMALLAHTGGTTGFPKSVMLSDNAMNAVAKGYLYMMKNAKRGDIFLHVMVPFVVYGALSCMHVPLCLGFCLVIVPKFDAEDWYKYLKKFRVNHILAVPSYVNPIISDKKVNKLNLSFLKNVGVGGDGLNEELEVNINDFLKAHKSPATLLTGYGLSEVSATAVSSYSQCCKSGSVGIPLPGNNMMIYDRENNKELLYNEVGEICLKCVSQMIEYMDNDKETKSILWQHKDGTEWLHTGDLGYIDEEGFLFLIGRMKRIILTTGNGVAYKVFPNIVEEVLNKHNGVSECCVVSATKGENQVLRAVIVLEKNRKGIESYIEQDLRKLCNNELPSHARPTYYEFFENLPLTAAGKVDYRLLEG